MSSIRDDSHHQLNVLIHCTKTSSDYHSPPHLLETQDHPFAIFERYKKDHGIPTISGSAIAMPVIISIENRLPFDIKDITFKINVQFHYSDKQDRLKKDVINPYIIKSDEVVHDILFDMSGFSRALVDITNVSYCDKDNDIPLNQLTTNTPLIIDTNEIQNAYNGFKDQKEMKIDFLLRNYISNSLRARGWLLKIMFSKLKEITNSKKIELDNKMLDLGESDLAILQGVIQIDIISKIMMYLEDLAILSSAMLVNNGNYYELLDRSESQPIELGDRISSFFDEVYNNQFTQEDYRRILGYYNPDELNQEASRIAVTKLINSNIESYRNIINLARKFRRSHSQIFRRYKHAGFPMKLGYKANIPFPYTSKRFDSYSMIFTGKDPLVDVLSLPYSESIIESYRNLVTDVQTFIQHMVYNHLELLGREIEGIIPTEQKIDARNYSLDSILTDQELSEITSCITQFNKTWPLRARNPFSYKEITKINKDEVGWYLELDALLEGARRKQELQD